MKEHRFAASVRWSGNTGQGTSNYAGYERRYEILAPGKPPIPGSSDPAFRGDGSRYNPEDLLVASVSACHMLWYLSLCSGAGLAVVSYEDEAEGTMTFDGHSGRFVSVLLRPRVRFAPGADLHRADELHQEANSRCFIANSLNFAVRHEAVHEVESGAGLRAAEDRSLAAVSAKAAEA
jgi:organic hydroperoxide reductase OsmC/OhrA